MIEAALCAVFWVAFWALWEKVEEALEERQ